VDTSRFGGKRMREIVAVQTNDPARPVVNLTIQGNVEKFVTIVPDKVMLLGPPGRPIKRSVKIIPEQTHPFRIIGVSAEKGDHIKYELKEIEEQGETAYLLTVENTKKGTGRYFDAVFLKTTSKIGPVIKILVWVNIKDKK
jgi:hypothetical protein